MSRSKPSSRLNRFRPFLRRWHYRLGLLSAVILVMVVLTGIALNHTHALQLSQRSVQSDWLLSWYGMEKPSLVSYSLGDQIVTGDDGGGLYLGEQYLERCEGRLVGAVARSFSLLACEKELLLLTPDGELVERLGARYGMPLPIWRLGVCGDQSGAVCFESGGVVYLADVDQLLWTTNQTAVNWSEEVVTPQALADSLYADQLGSELNWERVIQDLHSGRMGGSVGVWLIDAAAVVLLFLSLSGFWLWYQQNSRRR